MADDYQSQRPCECEIGQITLENPAMNPNYTCPCQTPLNLNYVRIQTITTPD